MTERPSSDTTWLTPPQLAKQLGVSPEKVLTWIRNGELRAVNVAERLSGRARWRISPEALEEFFRRRESKPPPPTYPRRPYRPRNGAGNVIRDDDARLAKNIPHEVRVLRMAKLMANRNTRDAENWRMYLQKAIARYAERHGIQIDEAAVLALEE